MRILAIETATEACSAALFEGSDLIGTRHEILGRGHAERLVPMIAELPDKGRSSEIRVSLGPGSFTGVRIGLATARALGIAWGAKVRGYPTLGLVAAMAQANTSSAVTVCMNGGHGEWFVQTFAASGLPATGVVSARPEAAAASELAPVLAGSRAEELAQLCAMQAGPVRLPDASHALSIPDEMLTDTLAPLYGRAPDAKLPGS